jgi:hypothetical protein
MFRDFDRSETEKIWIISQTLFRSFVFANSTQRIFCVCRNNSLHTLFTCMLAVKAIRCGPQTTGTASESAEFVPLLT